MSNQPACLDLPGIFGAGLTADAEPDVAAEMCRGCGLRDVCLETFALDNRPEHVPFNLTVAGLSNEHLRRAMKMIRERAA